MNPVLEILQRDLEKVFFWLISNPKQRYPLRDPVMVDDERRGDRFRSNIGKIFRKAVAIGAPLGFFGFPQGHLSSPLRVHGVRPLIDRRSRNDAKA